MSQKHLPTGIDESAINQIARLGIAAVEADRRVYIGASHAQKPAIILGTNEQLVKIDDLLLQRQRYRGAYDTRLIPGYVAYTKEMVGDLAPRVFVDDAKMTATAFLNAGDKANPGHCDHTATVTLRTTPFYDMLLNINGQRFTQKDFAELLEDWAAFWRAPATGTGDVVRAADPKNPFPDYTSAALPKAIQAVRSMKKKVETEQESKIRDMGGTVTGMSDTGITSDFEFPNMLVAQGLLYPDLDPQFVGVRLSIIWNEGQMPKIVPRIVMLEQLKEKLADLFKQRLEDDLKGTGAIVVIGSFNPNPK